MPTNFKIQITADSPFNLPSVDNLVSNENISYIQEKYIFTDKMQQSSDPMIPEDLNAGNINSYTTSSYVLTRNFADEESFKEYFYDLEIVQTHRKIKEFVESLGLTYSEIID